MNQTKIIFLFSLVGILVLSCIDDAINNFDSTVFYTASWSLPIGNTGHSLDDVLHENGYSTTCSDSVDFSIDPKWVNYDSCLVPSGDFPHVMVESYTESIDLTKILKNIEYAKSITLRLNLANSLPYTGIFLIRLFDAEGNFLLSLNDSHGFTMDAPSVDENGHISTPSLLQHDELIEGDDLDAFKRVAQIQVNYELYDLISEPDILYLESELSFDIQLGIRAALEMPLGESID